MFRFGKHRKDERPGEKMDRKGSNKWRTEETQVSDEETMKMRMEQERIQAKTRELRERQARERDYAEILDLRPPGRGFEEEHPYAGVTPLNSSVDSGHSRPQSPRDDYPPHQQPHLHHQHQHSDSPYTQGGKARGERPPSADR
ncbi:partitioning defective 3 homolog [Pungitius pungitius]|uniref:partitioning defective 3 homolog n=1 Tax=Pungitius pungitius TaxID=134920 RepID=UPI002E10D289